jgi:hypothetical protein
VLREHFVHAAYAGRNARAGVWHAHYLEDLLHCSVFSATAVEGHERDVGPRFTQSLDEVGAHVDRHHVSSELLQRVLDARCRSE